MITMAIGVVIIVVTAIVGQAARESLLLLAASLGSKIIQRAVRALPERRRLIREPEWLAEFQRQLDKGLAFGSLTFAVGCLIGAHRIRHEAPKEVPNDDRERSPLYGALGHLLQGLAHDVAHGGTAAIRSAWLSALIMSPVGAGLVLGHGSVRLAGVFILGCCAFYILAGFGVFARRIQLKRRKRQPS